MTVQQTLDAAVTAAKQTHHYGAAAPGVLAVDVGTCAGGMTPLADPAYRLVHAWLRQSAANTNAPAPLPAV